MRHVDMPDGFINLIQVQSVFKNIVTDLSETLDAQYYSACGHSKGLEGLPP